MHFGGIPMNVEQEIAYLRARERHERVAASSATDPAVHDAHFMMAERYADRAAILAEPISGISHGSASETVVSER